MARIGILTGGGDCPGLNAVIRAIVREGTARSGHEIVGFRRGWAGVLEDDTVALTRAAVAGILHRGGTILGSSRTNPYKGGADGATAVRAAMDASALDALIAIGGDDTLGVASRLTAAGIPVVGVPKTIDNDIAGTDVTFGFNTAVQIATDAIDRLHSTAESHDRVLVVEVMGRHAGWIAAHSGLAGGADIILVPEHPFDVTAVCDTLRRRHDEVAPFSIVVVSEGATVAAGGGPATVGDETDAFGHARLGGIANLLEREIEKRTGFDTRAVVLGHLQRGGTPTAYDRVLATRFGLAAIGAVDVGRFGVMTALRGTEIVLADLAEALSSPKLLDPAFYAETEVFYGVR